MLAVTKRWATPNIDETILYDARISSKHRDSTDKQLLRYLSENGHVSPLDMANLSVNITTTRDISRQALRHWSFRFQERSLRYTEAKGFVYRECRMQDKKNRQSSLDCTDYDTASWWFESQKRLLEEAVYIYNEALKRGIAKEVARAVLPEGLTLTEVVMNGTIRSWIFYLKQRLDPSTQKEHREIAAKVLFILHDVAPITTEAYFDEYFRST